MTTTPPPASTEPLNRVDLMRTDKNGALRCSRYRVTVVEGADRGASALVDGVLYIGTSPDAGLRLSDPSVSRMHLELHSGPEGLLVKDLGSTNGTFVSGARVTEALVRLDSSFGVGKSVFRVSLDDQDIGLPMHPDDSFGEAIGVSKAMRQVFGVLARAAATNSSIILLGETGTGKDLLARAVHQASLRAARPFVVVDCGALAPELIESELFGHHKGAFTGAVADRTGAFQLAHGGTLMLNEIGELPLTLQPKLLRALETGEVRPLGSDTTIKVNVRVVAATHRDLEVDIAAGKFRSDLFFRLAVVVVRVPALRERREDIQKLVEKFMREEGCPGFTLPERLMRELADHPWPGNIRELRNFVSRAILQGDATTDRPKPVDILPFKESKERMIESFTREYLTALISKCHGNMSEVARTALMSRTRLYELLQKYGLDAQTAPRTPGNPSEK